MSDTEEEERDHLGARVGVCLAAAESLWRHEPVPAVCL